MTSIIFDGKTLVTDSAATNGDRYCGSAKKIHHLANGLVVATSGCFEATTRAIDWLTKGGVKPIMKDDFVLLIIHPDGTYDCMYENLIGVYTPLPVVLGSGSWFLAGAYDQCGDVHKAMITACKLDVFSSGPMQVHEI